jgi:hypothetical protein
MHGVKRVCLMPRNAPDLHSDNLKSILFDKSQNLAHMPVRYRIGLNHCKSSFKCHSIFLSV